MKNIIGLFVIGVMAFFFAPQQVNAQCSTELYVTKSMKALSKGYQFSKSYRIDGRNGTRKTIKYTCVFAKDTSYEIAMRGQDGDAEGMIATLYDAKRNKQITSFIGNKFHNSWRFKCTATGIYYLHFTFKDSKSYCGAAVLGFKR
ncbi:hypothetical protein [Algivirga pacifica]|uniref:Uncharacterized protein n=1 Tax=Algivirga pacifica TaxID=1162670 RepID=A0ABP9DB92_9BACT